MWALCHDVTQRLGVLAHARVPADYGHELWGFAKNFRGCEVHGIERADGFEWKAAAARNT